MIILGSPLWGAVSSVSNRLALSARQIAQLLTSPTEPVHLFVIGDSRTAGDQVVIFSSATDIVWGGLSYATSLAAIDSAGAHDSAALAPAANDGTTASTIPGLTNINDYAPHFVVETEFLGGTESSANILIPRLLTTQIAQANFPSIWTRYQSSPEAFKAKVALYLHSGAMGSDPGIKLSWRRTSGSDEGDAGGYQSASAITDLTGSGYAVAEIDVDSSFDWSSYAHVNLEVYATKGGSTVNGETVAFATLPWMESETGVVLHAWSVGGRTIDGWLDDTVFNSAIFTDLVPLFGDRRVAWIDLGTNNTASNDQAAHETKLKQLIANFRAGSPLAPVILTTAYPSSTDTGVPYYVLAARAVAAEVQGVLLIDTYEEMPDYTTGSGLGYYSDTVHYNDTGNAAFYAKISELIAAAAV